MDVEEVVRFTMSSPTIVVPENAALTGGTAENFVQVGCDVFRSLVVAGGLKQTDRVLEIGSGLGRVAYPLTRYLESPGSYIGLEIVKDSVDFCNSHVACLSNLFSFRHLDLFNEFYNANGQLALIDTAINFEEAEFDFIFMSSVLTHLEYSDLVYYMTNSAKWLRRGGRLWATMFLVDAAAENALADARTQPSTAAGTLRFDLSGDGPDYFLMGKRSTVAVAYRLPFIESLLHQCGYRLVELGLGQWSGADRVGGYQDLLVLERV
jgi:SAM-dependent methyltransferase